MMKSLMMLFFLTPLFITGSIDLYMLFQFSYIVIFMILMFTGFNSYYSNISYIFGLDSYSYGLILMTLIIGLLMIISMLIYSSINMFLFVNLMMTILLMVIFSSLNFMYMYMCFEFVLIPLMILIMGWGYQPERLLAGLYLFMYTFFVSLPLLFLMIYIYMILGSMFFDYLMLSGYYLLNYFILIVVFMVKFPMFLVHFWLPKAHVQAPVSGSMILAGLMLKIGGYGIIRTMYIYEYMFMKYSFVWFSFSLVGSVMISVVCLMQADMKCMIAYSSISHMGMVIMGLMTMNMWGLMGSYFLMLGHGFCSSGLFYMSNLFYSRTNSRSFYINKGLLSYFPSCGMAFFMFCAFNMSCPPSLNFFSELMIIPAIMSFWLGSSLYFLGLSFFCACFSYYLYSYSFQGLFHNLYSFSSININELLCMFMHILPLIMIPLFFSCLI